MVSVSRYAFEHHGGDVAFLRTPAQQFLISLRRAHKNEAIAGEIPLSFNPPKSLPRGRIAEWRRQIEDMRPKIAMPSETARRWLDANAPGWACPPNYREEDFAFFFEKRRHAVEFCKWVDNRLAGMKFWNS
jgi:hypothetical protein